MIATIKKTAQIAGVPEYVLRRMLKANQLPGFFSGSRFYVNVDAFKEMLNGTVDAETGIHTYLRVPTVEALEQA